MNSFFKKNASINKISIFDFELIFFLNNLNDSIKNIVFDEIETKIENFFENHENVFDIT